MATTSAAFRRCSSVRRSRVRPGAREDSRAREALAGGDRVVVPGIATTFDVIDVPGHTAGHIALFGEFGGGPVLFCGDTLFTGGCGRLFEGTPAQMWSSLSALAALPPETRVYCGHEYTLANLRFALAVEPRQRGTGARDARAQASARPRGADGAVDDGRGARDQSLPARARAAVKAAAAAHTGQHAAGRRRVVRGAARVEEPLLGLGLTRTLPAYHRLNFGQRPAPIAPRGAPTGNRIALKRIAHPSALPPR